MEMTPSVPYLLRAIYEWILDNGCTPHLIVDATAPEVSVPAKGIKDGQIILNISPEATRGLVIDNDLVTFSGRFSGIPHEVSVPIDAVLGIVAKENHEGIWFPKADDGPGPDRPQGPESPKGKPALRVVK